MTARLLCLAATVTAIGLVMLPVQVNVQKRASLLIDSRPGVARLASKISPRITSDAKQEVGE